MISGSRIRALREAHSLSAEALSRQLQMSKSQLLRYENNKADATTDVLVRFAKFFNVSADYLLELTTDSAPNLVPGDLAFDEVMLLTAWRKGDYVDVMKILFDSYADKKYDIFSKPLESDDLDNIDFDDID